MERIPFFIGIIYTTRIFRCFRYLPWEEVEVWGEDGALEPGTVIPIHRHLGSSETCVCIRGHFEEYFYDSEVRLTETVDMVPGGVVLSIEKGHWHSLKCLESGTVLLEAKDGEYRPLEEEIMVK